MTLKALLFDLDNTLVPEMANYELAFDDACRATAVANGIDLASLRQAVFGHANELWEQSATFGYCSSLGIGSPTSLLSEFPGDRPEFATLREWAPLAVLTNGPIDVQVAKLSASGLQRFFPVVVASGEIGYGKPDPRLFGAALDRLRVDRADAVAIGDSLERDVVGAHAAGLRCVWLNRQRTSMPATGTADFEISSLDELPGLFS
ncbi:MAG: HAD family hydrolase [Chloroflexi bacterium]|nr:MAG: HAD family hydrolase [Chloroflexota bacterium]